MLIPRYQIRQFLSTVVFTVVALCALFVVVDVIERLDKFIDHRVGIVDIGRFYVAYLPFMLQLVIPVATLLAALFSVGRLSATNELTAMRAAGASPLRLLAPYVVIGCLLSGGQLYFNGWVVPRASSERLMLERTLLQEGAGGSLFNLYFRDVPTRTVFIEYYDKDRSVARNVRIEEFGSVAEPRLHWRMEAPSMSWDQEQACWTAPEAWRRSWLEPGGRMTLTRLDSATMPFSIRQEDIQRLQRGVEELDLDEMKSYIATMQAGGRDVRALLIEYYAKWAFPFANVIVVLIAVPFAGVRRKGGIAIHIAVAMVLAFAYIVCSEIAKAVGLSTDLPPAAVGWSANIVFALIAVAGLGRR